MLVDGTDAEVAAAGHGHGGLAEAAQQRADESSSARMRRTRSKDGWVDVDMAAVDLHRVAVQHPDIGPQLLQNGKQQRYVADLGDILNAADPVHQQGSGDDGNGGVFAPLMVTSPISGRPPWMIYLFKTGTLS